jgi:uncharacterized protein (UPF0297 family)
MLTLVETATEFQDRLDQATARLAEMAGEHTEALAAKDVEIATLTEAYNTLEAFRASMVQQVTTVLQSGDPAQFEALAVAFLTPAQTKLRDEALARAAALEAEAAAIKEQFKDA